MFNLTPSSSNLCLGPITVAYLTCTNSEVYLTKSSTLGNWSLPEDAIYIQGSPIDDSVIVFFTSLGDKTIIAGDQVFSYFVTISTSRTLPTINMNATTFCLGVDTAVAISSSTGGTEYLWTIENTSNSTISYTNTNSSFNFYPSAIGSFQVQLIVNDCCGWSAPVIQQVSLLFIFKTES